MGQDGRANVATLVLAATCLVIAAFAGYGAYAVTDQDAFADRAVAILATSDEVREDVGERMSGRLTIESPELSAGEELMSDAAAEMVTTHPAFQANFRIAVLDLHRALFEDPDAEASLRVAGSGRMLGDALAARHPGAEIPRLEDVPLLTIGFGGAEHVLREAAVPAGRLALPAALAFGLLGIVLLGTAAVRERSRRRAVWACGLTVAAAAALVAALVTAGKDVVLGRFDTGFGDAVVSTVWDAYLGDLRLWGLVACAAGLIVAAAAGGPRPSVSSLLEAPATRRCLVLRGAGLLAVAVLAVELPELVLHTGLVALAAGLFYVAAGDLLRATRPRRRPAAPGRAAAAVSARSSTPRPRSSSRPRRTW